MLFDFGEGSSSVSAQPAASGLIWSVPPAVFGQYRLDVDETGAVRELGRGGMGVTYRAFDTQLEIPVVLKFISPLVLGGRAIEQRFLREARVAARLRHQSIATILNLGEHGGRWFYAMEFVEGRTLDQQVRSEGPLPAAEAREIGLQVAQALAEAERHQMVHRDIKPSNLMVARRNGSWQVKVIDFGLVKSLDAVREDGALTEEGLLGTPHFASPEQLREGAVDNRSDFYSLGATLYFALTGKTLAKGARAEIMARHLQPPGGHVLRSAKLPAGAASEFGRCLEQLLQPDPKRRPATAPELESCLRQVGAARRPWPWIGAVGFAAAIATGILLWNGEADRSDDLPSGSAAELVRSGESYFSRYTTGDNEHAIRIFNKALRQEPGFPAARAARADAYSQRHLRFGYPAKWASAAEQEASATLVDNPNFVPGLRALGLALFAQGYFSESLSTQKQALSLVPDEPIVLRQVAAIWRALGKFEHALGFAVRSCESGPKEYLSWSIRANLEKKLDRDEQAIASYRQAYVLSRGTVEPLLGICHVRFLQKDFAAARAALAEAQDLKGDEADRLCLQAMISLQEGKDAEAEAALREAVALKRTGNPLGFGQVRYLSLLGWLLKKTGRVEEGLALLKEAEGLDRTALAGGSRSQSFRYSLAASLVAQGRVEEGKEFLTEAIRRGWKDWRSTLLEPRFEPIIDWIREQQSRSIAALPTSTQY